MPSSLTTTLSFRKALPFVLDSQLPNVVLRFIQVGDSFILDIDKKKVKADNSDKHLEKVIQIVNHINLDYKLISSNEYPNASVLGFGETTDRSQAMKVYVVLNYVNKPRGFKKKS